MATSHVQVTFPIFGILGVLFVALKLTDQIDWSWWWVLSPFWLPTAVFVGVTFVIATLLSIFSIFTRGRK